MAEPDNETISSARLVLLFDLDTSSIISGLKIGVWNNSGLRLLICTDRQSFSTSPNCLWLVCGKFMINHLNIWTNVCYHRKIVWLAPRIWQHPGTLDTLHETNMILTTKILAHVSQHFFCKLCIGGVSFLCAYVYDGWKFERWQTKDWSEVLKALSCIARIASVLNWGAQLHSRKWMTL